MKTRTQPTYSFGTMVFRPRARQYLANDLIITVVCLAGLAVAGIDGVFMGNMLLWASLTIAMCLVYRFLYLRSMRFIITEEQFIYEHGVFRRTRDFMELYRIVDFREESSFPQRIFGLKTIQIYSGDRSTPRLDMTGMDMRADLIPSYVNVWARAAKEMEYMRLPTAKILTVILVVLASMQARAQLVVSNPLEWLALAEGNEAINGQMQDQTDAQTRTAALQNTIAAEFTKIHEWEKKYSGYLQTASGFASSLKASATLYEDGVRIFITLGKLRNAIGSNPQGIVATMSMNNLYLETATELISVYTLLREAIATGGRTNMLTGAERSQTLWALSDKLGSFSKKLNRLYLSIRYYTLTDVWNNITAGMLDRDIGSIAGDALDRWKRAAKAIE